MKSPRELSLAVASTPIDKLVTAEAIRGVEHRMFQVKVTDRPLNVNGVRR